VLLRALTAAFIAMVVAVGCASETPVETKEPEEGTEETRYVTQVVTVEETVSPEATDEAHVSQEESPENVLALQYEYINAGDYEKAYSLFAQQSRQAVSLEQYRAFFEANAPYSVTDYSFSPAQIEGNSASVDVAVTANSASGSERLERTQQFVRENGSWLVLMRPEQVAIFTADEGADAAPEQAITPKQTPKTKVERGADASDVVLRISGTPGVPYRGSFGGIAESVSGRQPIEGTIGEGQNEFLLSDITGDVRVRTVSASANKIGANVQGDLRLQILYQGEVVAENLATGTASVVVVPWSPGFP
jgi:hypothetical protein